MAHTVESESKQGAKTMLKGLSVCLCTCVRTLEVPSTSHNSVSLLFLAVGSTIFYSCRKKIGCVSFTFLVSCLLFCTVLVVI